uniref:Cation_ATPase_C domain-containing protein n=1 Tax=Steinernema glaseri TaxID=37863 RepID=A0A1I7Z295_9BILA
MDDKFASIIHGIEEGRLLFDNLRKSIAYTLTHCCACIFPMLLNFIGGVPAPMSALQMLSMDLGTDLPPAISLAYENPESNIMKYPPRKRGTRLVSFAMLSYSYLITPVIICIGSFAAYYYTFWKNDVNPHDLWFTDSKYFVSPVSGGNFTASSGRTLDPDQQIDVAYQAAAACYITTVTSQAYHIWMCRTRKASIITHGFRNVYTFLAVISMVVVTVLLVYVPGLREGMGSSPPPPEVWAFSFGNAVLLMIYNEVRKFFIRRSPYNKFVRLVKW